MTNERNEPRKVKKVIKDQETMMIQTPEKKGKNPPRLLFDDSDSDLLTYKEKDRYHKTKENVDTR